MTTAARPTWAPAKGGNEQGGARIFGASQKYSSRDVAAHTTLKPRREGQHTQEEVQKKNLRDELEDRERIHFSSKDKSYSDDRDRRSGNQLLLEGSKRDPEDRIVPRSVDADDSDVDIKSDDESDDESDDDDEDDTEALMAELDQIKRERVEERLRKEKQQQMEELNAKEEELLKGNPLLNNTPTSFSVKRRWDDDVVFKNQARGEMKAPKRFINDTIRNDFHRKFLHRYMNRFEPYGSGFGGEGYGGRHMVVVLVEEGKATVDMVGPLNLAAQVSIMEEQVVHMGEEPGSSKMIDCDGMTSITGSTICKKVERNKEEEIKKMEGKEKEKEEAKRRTMMMNKIKLKETEQEISQEDVKRQEAYNMSPRTRGGGGPAGMVKSSSVRLSCLCAPTTHPGSFRCRYHRRNAGLGMSRGISVPTNLSMLAGGGSGSNATSSGSPKS